MKLQLASILSGLTVHELARGVRLDDDLERQGEAAGAKKVALAAKNLTPMLARTAEEPFSLAGWIFELKYDGVRTLVCRAPYGNIRLLSRNRRDMTQTFPEIAAAASHLTCRSFVVDGKIIAIDPRGSCWFELLQRRRGPVSMPLGWPEVTRRLNPLRHNLQTVPRRLRRRPDPMRAVLGASLQVADLLGALQKRLEGS